MTRRIRTVLAIAAVGGAVESLQRLLAELPEEDVDAVAVVGDLSAPWSKSDTYRAILRALGESRRPAYWVPGPMDAPLRGYLQESANMEIVFPQLRSVHGTVAVAPGSILFAGMGGEIVDDPDAMRAEEALLRYPGWEVEYRLKIVREFEELQHVFLFATPPAHKGLGEPGSTVLAELIKTYRPRLAIVGGGRALGERLGRTLVVCPGRFDEGSYAFVDLGSLSVQSETLSRDAEPATVLKP